MFYELTLDGAPKTLHTLEAAFWTELRALVAMPADDSPCSTEEKTAYNGGCML